jgi:indole-3-glycerol phosphate synthase
LLQTIVAATERIVAVRAAQEPAAALELRARTRTPHGARFRDQLARPDHINVIAECKRRSPSRGVLRSPYDPVDIAQAYARAGAAALSVLTEPTFFDGSLHHLSAIRDAVSLPLLRKDFIVDSYQLLEARANGADAVLLIVAALSDAQLQRLHREAHELGLAALVEVHDADEVARALAAGAEIIGVNNRNLRTLQVDTHASELAAERIPSHVVAVSESGLKNAVDLAHMRQFGYGAFLIGERLMTCADPGETLRDLLQSAEGLSRGVAP